MKLLALLFCGALPLTAAAEPTTLTMLDRGEPHEAMMFHDHHLFVGKSRTNFNSDYRLEVYDENLQLVNTIRLGHSATYIHAYGPHSVIVHGTAINPEPNHTAYTIVDGNGGSFRTNLYAIGIEAWAFRWLGNVNGREYFADPGGNVNDPESDPQVPAQTIFGFNGSSSRYLNVRMRMPTAGMAVGNKLFVVQSQGIGDPRTNLAIVDPASQQMQYVFPAFKNSLQDIVQIPGSQTVVLSEKGNAKLIVINAATKEVVSEIETDARPRSLAAFGNCVAVGNEESRTIQIFDLRNPAMPKNNGKIAVDLPQNEFKWLAKIAVDLQKRTIYARSNSACNPMAMACDSDWNRVIAYRADDSAELLEPCELN